MSLKPIVAEHEESQESTLTALDVSAVLAYGIVPPSPSNLVTKDVDSKTINVHTSSPGHNTFTTVSDSITPLTVSPHIFDGSSSNSVSTPTSPYGSVLQKKRLYLSPNLRITAPSPIPSTSAQSTPRSPQSDSSSMQYLSDGTETPSVNMEFVIPNHSVDDTQYGQHHDVHHVQRAETEGGGSNHVRFKDLDGDSITSDKWININFDINDSNGDRKLSPNSVFHLHQIHEQSLFEPTDLNQGFAVSIHPNIPSMPRRKMIDRYIRMNDRGTDVMFDVYSETESNDTICCVSSGALKSGYHEFSLKVLQCDVYKQGIW